MQDLQEILSPIVPAWAGAWQPSDEGDVPPEQYLVYVVENREVAWADDEPWAWERFATMCLWSTTDPTLTAARIRAAMKEAGWNLEKETAGGNGYENIAHRYNVEWVFRSCTEFMG